MALIGQSNRMKIQTLTERGAMLDGGELGDILLPKSQVPAGAKVEDRIEVFVYPESKKEFIAMTEIPAAEVGQLAFLEVVELNNVGAFLDWGIGKNLFLPFSEQPQELRVGSKYVVYIYLDNTGRVAASTKIKKFMGKVSPNYAAGDEVSLFVIRETDLGWETAVDDEFLGMIFHNDALGQCAPGNQLDGFIKAIRDKGLVDLCLQPPTTTRRTLGEQILADLKASGGSTTLTDKSSPDQIYAKYGVSKRAYKDALGGLFRQRLITLSPGLVKLNDAD